jgi:predicted aspartyl protease
MSTKGDYEMGRFDVEFEVANEEDILDARRGMIKEDQVRRVILKGVVDCGATRLVLPGTVVEKLGLPSSGRIRVRYANHETTVRDAVKGVYVKLLGRDGVFTAAVEPKRRSALIGAIVLEDLDFLVDCTGQKLAPRDPRFVVSELE